MPRCFGLTATFVLAALIAGALPHQAAAQTDTAPAALKAQIAELEKQLTTLRSALAAQAKPATPTAPDPTALLKPAGTQRKPVASPRGPRRIQSVTDLLEHLPKTLQPGQNGLWHPAVEPNTIDYLTYGVWDTPYVTELVVQAVRVEDNPALAADTLASPYKITISFEPIGHTFHEQTLREAFAPVVIYADARQRKRIDRLKPGRKTQVRATLKTMVCGSTASRHLKPRSFHGGIQITNHFKTFAIPGVINE